jgi:hypothetical protein
MEVIGQLKVPAALLPGEGVPSTHRIGDWMGPTAGMNDMEKRQLFTSAGLELRALGRSATRGQ